MCFDRGGRRVLVATVSEQRAYIALVVDFDGLLRRGRLVARRRWLEDESVDSSEYQQLAD